MIKEAALKYKPEIAALQDGKTIQRRYSGSPWCDDLDPYFVVDPLVEFRIKPEPRELWRILCKGAPGPNAWSSHATLKLAEIELNKQSNPDFCEIVHFKEVL